MDFDENQGIFAANPVAKDILNVASRLNIR
jgi:hypothetical protein